MAWMQYCAVQQRPLDLLELELQAFKYHLMCVCWEPNLTSLEEQKALLTTELSSSPQIFFDNTILVNTFQVVMHYAY